MRVIWKLCVIVLAGVVAQWGLVRAANDIEDAAFTMRVFSARCTGVPVNDPELLAAADRLLRRQSVGRADAAHVEVERAMVAVAADF